MTNWLGLIRLGEVIEEPCTLPADVGPPVDKWFNRFDLELLKPTKVDVAGFLISWLVVGLLIGIVMVGARI